MSDEQSVCLVKYRLKAMRKTTSKVFGTWEPGDIVVLTFDICELMIQNWGSLTPVSAYNYTTSHDIKIGRRDVSTFFKIFTIDKLTDEEFIDELSKIKRR